MKNIVKVADSLGCVPWVGRSSSTAPEPTRRSPPTKRKNLVGCLFVLGAHAIVAKPKVGCGLHEYQSFFMPFRALPF
ncbi:hypothetical protein [Paenibacillus eucommiae]|uniref:Uncharacterized protein n=1 Tax=Paenibacillus eucommiae TaxID=1355755 RepID=A0ABS4IP85_9BACL|nr:hypothetical protein [Paenibacillus eucommiae]MBP1989377.1 hypothetical protein [Paenibacillus eucommiae]